MKNPIKNIFKVKNKTNMQEWVALADFLGLDKSMSKDERSEATYFACLKILSESLGKLPLKLMKKTDKNGVVEARNHVLYSKVRYRPNRFMTSTTFWGTMEYFRNHDGNAIAYISNSGSKLELVPLNYNEVQIWYDDACILSKTPDVFYLYSHGGQTYKFSSEEVLHLKSSATDDGIVGLSVRQKLATTIDSNKKAQNLQNSLYESGFTAKFAVQYTGDLNSENTKSFLSQIANYAKGKFEPSKGLIPIPPGSSLIPLNTKLGDNEFLELKRYSASQIAAAFGIKINVPFMKDFNSFFWGLLVLVLNSSAYVAEIVRSGIGAVDSGQIEAARSLGMSHGLTLKMVILPQALRNILPALMNEFVSIIKETSIVSLVGISELMFCAKDVVSISYRTLEPYVIAAIIYFIMVFPLSKLVAYIERRLNASVTR